MGVYPFGESSARENCFSSKLGTMARVILPVMEAADWWELPALQGASSTVGEHFQMSGVWSSGSCFPAATSVRLLASHPASPPSPSPASPSLLLSRFPPSQDQFSYTENTFPPVQFRLAKSEFWWIFFFFFGEGSWVRVSLYSPGCLGTRSRLT